MGRLNMVKGGGKWSGVVWMPDRERVNGERLNGEGIFDEGMYMEVKSILALRLF